ncbi:hypothetical protein C0J52_17628 [Blattella germanica]|nr:hypothetical protein C0J52_17628 [Blattella germanica]
MESNFILKGRTIESLPAVPIWQYVEDKITNFGHKIAQMEVGTKREITFTEILYKSRCLSDGLKAQGIKYGDVVAICSENNIDYCWIVLGVLQANACCALVSPTYTPREWEHALSIAQPKLVMCSKTVCETKLEQYLQTGNVKEVLVWGYEDKQLPKNCTALEDVLLEQKEVEHQMSLSIREHNEMNGVHGKNPKEHPAFILSSSGSTGLPKGVITCLHLVASLLVFLLKRDVLDKPECKSVQHIWTGAAPLSPKIQLLALEKLGGRAVLHHSYGLTETTFTMFTCIVENSSLGTPGRLTPGMECKVIDINTGKTIGPNCRGELCFRGPLLMKEYIRNEEATKKTVDVDGWLQSGDLGYYNENGYFYIVDRLKEIIKYQGYQVSPSELETILIMHPAVQDAAVVGIEDEIYGELPRAFIVKETGSSVTSDDIKEFISGKYNHLYFY